MKKIIWVLIASFTVSPAFALPSRTTAAATPAPGSGPTKGAVVNGNTLHSTKGDVDFSKANPEDITNENFPNLIESFDYPNADIAEVVKAISKLTGKNFILEKGVNGKISIIAPSQITVAEAYKAFLTALAMNNYTVVPSGSFLKIRSLSVAAKESIDTYAGSYFPNADQLITRIIKLKYISAEEVQKTLRAIVNQNGDITPYIPTNSLIVTDMGSNIERISTIINQLDVPGFEEKLVVIPIKFARSKDMADLIDKIINKGDKNANSSFNSGIPRFRPAGSSSPGSGSGAANYSLVIPDNRTNSIIVVGNDAGIERIRGLVAKLDFRIRPEDGGNVWVYYVRHGEAEKIANVLNGIASESTKKAQQAGAGTGGTGPIPTAAIPSAPVEPVFGGDVKVQADKDNNSLVVTAGKQDYETVRSILAKIDIPRDQVFVKAIFMELSVTNQSTWGINYFKFLNNSGSARSSFVSGGQSVTDLADFTKDSGLTLGWGSNDTVTVTPPGSTTSIQVPSLLALIKFIKTTTSTNLLSAPQLSALDNEDAEIEVGNNVPVSNNTTITTGGTPSSSIERKDLTLKMKLTPHISPDTDSVRMKIDTKIMDLTNINVSSASALAQNAIAYSTRSLVTNIVVNSGDTSVLGGLMKDQDGDSVTKIPILGDIPILGWLFKSKTTNKSKMNLLVFLTPKIIRNTQDNSDLLNNRLNDRIDFIQQNLSGRDPYGEEIDKMPRHASAEEDSNDYDNKVQVPSARGGKRSGPAFREKEMHKNNEDNSATKPVEPAINAQPSPGDAEEGE